MGIAREHQSLSSLEDSTKWAVKAGGKENRADFLLSVEKIFLQVTNKEQGFRKSQDSLGQIAELDSGSGPSKRRQVFQGTFKHKLISAI